jgi:glycosyltransferase involved in cell wall biosynthesis
MHLVTVAPSVPEPSTGGGGNWNSSLIRHLAKAGRRVTHVAVIGKHESIRVNEDAIQAYKKLGVDVIVLPYKRVGRKQRGVVRNIKALVNPSFEDLWPDEWESRSAVIATLGKIRPDCVLPFAFDAVLYTHGLRCAPRVAFLAEGPHINTYINWRYDPPTEPGISTDYIGYSLRMLLLKSLQESLYIRLIRDLRVAAFAGPHYVQWAHRKGLSNAVFITTPVPDPVGAQWEHLRSAAAQNTKCKILVIGHLHSTSNKAGLPLLFCEVLPALEKLWGQERFEIHIVGRNEAMPSRFDSFRAHPCLKFRGPLFPADGEFLSSDILLVPIPVKTGSRVRIINGFTYGCCIVAHTANALGIQELKHDHNVLMGETGIDLAQQIIRAAGDPQLRRRLGENGRRTYERFYTEEAGGEQYLQFIQRAISAFESEAKASSLHRSEAHT